MPCGMITLTHFLDRDEYHGLGTKDYEESRVVGRVVQDIRQHGGVLVAGESRCRTRRDVELAHELMRMIGAATTYHFSHPL